MTDRYAAESNVGGYAVVEDGPADLERTVNAALEQLGNHAAAAGELYGSTLTTALLATPDGRGVLTTIRTSTLTLRRMVDQAVVEREREHIATKRLLEERHIANGHLERTLLLADQITERARAVLDHHDQPAPARLALSVGLLAEHARIVRRHLHGPDTTGQQGNPATPDDDETHGWGGPAGEIPPTDSF